MTEYEIMSKLNSIEIELAGLRFPIVGVNLTAHELRQIAFKVDEIAQQAKEIRNTARDLLRDTLDKGVVAPTEDKVEQAIEEVVNEGGKRTPEDFIKLVKDLFNVNATIGTKGFSKGNIILHIADGRQYPDIRKFLDTSEVLFEERDVDGELYFYIPLAQLKQRLAQESVDGEATKKVDDVDQFIEMVTNELEMNGLDYKLAYSSERSQALVDVKKLLRDEGFVLFRVLRWADAVTRVFHHPSGVEADVETQSLENNQFQMRVKLRKEGVEGG